MTTMNTDESGRCDALRAELAALAEDDPAAVERHADHLTECDACRDARHEARALAALLGSAGEGWAAGDDLAARIMAAVDGGLAAGAAPVHARQTAASDVAVPAPSPPASSAASPSPAVTAEGPRPRAEPPEPAQAKPAPSAPRRLVTPRRALVALACAAGLAGAVWGGTSLLADRAPGDAVAPAVAMSPLSGHLETVARAGADAGVTGITMRAPGADEAAGATTGQSVPPGATLETDRRTRARVSLSDGSVLVLDHDTRIVLDPAAPRSVRLERGALVADVAHLGTAPRATFATPEGRVEVLGTKFVLTSDQEVTSVEVVRGVVRLGPERGRSGWAEVAAGQEGLVASGSKPRVMPISRVASAVRWSELEETRDDGASGSSGLGVLRARRPGETGDREHPLSLSLHKVSVRIAGNVARTEIEERFANDGPNVLEGTYEFPLPSDARIVRLALDVEGRLVDGAIVERDRAAKIWAGVIRHATPVAARVKKEEFVWVPGPWRDPALLEWRAGGRFGLRVFPIPARGERRVILAYEQVLPAHGDGRRYVYPLPHPVGSGARAARFELDARVSGADRSVPVRVRGYDARTTQEGSASRLTYAEDAFVPAGDLVIDWALADRDAELRAWTYRGTAPAGGGDDDRGWALLALRPELPAWTEARRQDVAIVVDASQSMFGERFGRAADLARALVAEMDRRDRFLVLACDATCQVMPGGARPPSAEAASEVRSWLAGIRPGGASDLVAALATAARAIGDVRGDGRGVRVVYLGDGVATVGHRRASSVEAEVAALAGEASFTTVGIGGEADAWLLAGIARAGGGQYVSYGPSDSLSGAAMAVLETTMGPSLEQATLTLPAGLEEVAPALLPTVRAGEELVVAARLAGPVRGEAVLRGRVGGSPFERRYPLALDPTPDAGNSFVPAVWAERRIADLDREDGPDAQGRIVALSKRYGVVSRHTSLLVLESEAMFRAFGVERDEPIASWSGDEEPVASVASGLATGDGLAAQMPTSRPRLARRGHGAGNTNLDALVGGGSVATGGGIGSTRGGAVVRGQVSPQALQSSSAVSGSIDRAAVSRVVRQHMSDIQRVYERALMRDPTAEGRIVLTWTIQPDGSVGSVSAQGAQGSLGPELSSVVRRWRFPAPGGAGPVRVSYPFLFRSTGDFTARAREPERNVVTDRPADPAPAASPPRANEAPESAATTQAALQQLAAGPGRPRPGGGRWMRRTWVRRAQIGADGSVRPAELRAVEEAEASVRELPDSRDRHEALARALSRAGEIDRALELVEKWLGKDPFDVDALLALSDALARSGRRAEALRLLSGAVDVAPDDRTLHERLAAAFGRLGEAGRACAHRVTIAELAPTDEAALAAAVRCEAEGGRTAAAERIAGRIADASLRGRVRAKAAETPRVIHPDGEVTLDATWSGDEDVDVALVTPKGARLSLLGGRSGLSAEDGAAPGHERIGLRFLPAGNYLVEVTRSAPGDGSLVRGRVAIQALGVRRTVDFALEGARTSVARIDIRREQVLQPAF